jgi:RND family efflux transporter MFP subunit
MRPKSRGRHTLLFLLFILISINLVACGDKSSGKEPGTSVSAQTSPPTAAAPLQVSVVEAIERTVARSIEIMGSLDGQEEITVSSEVDGKIEDVYIDFGSYVKAGDRLVGLDLREFKLKVEQAEAAVASAEARLGPVGGPPVPLEEHSEVRQAKAVMDQSKAEFDRAERLIKNGDISRQTYDQIKALYDQASAKLATSVSQVWVYRANLDQARSQLSLARKQLADAVINAPISGAIKERLASKGEYVIKGRNIARIVQLDPLRLRGEVPEQYINQLRVNQPVSFSVDNMPGTEFHGILTRLSPAVDKRSRSLTVEASVRNQGLHLKPGLFARATIATTAKSAAVMVPKRAVINTAGLAKVYLLVDNQARAREVKLGQTEGDLIEILEGVRPGDQIITDNLDKLQDGSPVSKN